MTKNFLGKILIIIIFWCSGYSLYSQTIKKDLTITRLTTPIVIDGNLDEDEWQSGAIAKDFIQFKPYNGAKPSQKTEIRILYDDNSIYFGATMFDSSPDSIMKGFAKRDRFHDINSDYLTIDICPFNDGLYSFSFKISASGVQGDEKISNDEFDSNWDAVWVSNVKITKQGWIAEIKIPYSAIRFPKKDNQLWGINFWRHIRRNREWSTWNFVDSKIENSLSQTGEIKGMQNISPPLRLSISPYISAYVEKNPDSKKIGYLFNGGMDLKYGINESFTIDMTLIPDFGQVQSDDILLNLSPFEIRYSEKRQFFTEGTELFNKCEIFYSRRIGSSPVNYGSVEDNLKDGGRIVENPSETNLINATKFSGRTKNGLGIGVFNAMTSNTYATIADSNDIKRKFLTQAFTNYNLFVFDKILKNNSFISFINTNVSRESNIYSANVSATDFKLANKKNTYAIMGRGIISQKYNSLHKPEFGHLYAVLLSKISGNFKFELAQLAESDNYDPNDMGFLDKNNEFTNYLELEYNIYEPFWKLLDFSCDISFEHKSLYVPRKYSEFDVYLSSMATTKKHITIGLNGDIIPFEVHDYYESRNISQVFLRPSSHRLAFWFSSDYRKKFALDGRSGYRNYNSDKSYYWFTISPRFRINDKMILIHEFYKENTSNGIGYVTTVTDSLSNKTIQFGKRNHNTTINTLTSSYIFNNKSSISFRLRHYWSIVKYSEYYKLNEDGSVGSTTYSEPHDINFNIFNIDLVYTWQFAPGSEISVVWKNMIYSENDILKEDFFENFDKTINSPQTNSFSVKILYYLDYQSLKRKNHSLKSG
ncbi:MAG: carbohydrate binding family 9 domain-containing protein [Bacteroidetes bacterium]|nr:carbohydrate binding family 9 domain-containing protein [Bacteroidota bacterium]